ncbi:MAG: ATP synthase F1 subunit delta [Saprospirales bacterium]|nr:ATP synthase F1 subunit delta [Saprospirales bacterium]MBK8489789.1 ATP synthase F1 subunit delta [Saprospirales bacterium]
MSVARIASRYAKSLLDLAIERQEVERVREDLDTFASALKNREFYLMIKSPIVKADKKRKIFQLLFESKFDKLTMAFLNILLTKGREMYLPEVAKEFTAQYRAYKHISSVCITTAEPISEAVVETIRKKLLDQGILEGHLEMETKVDPSLVGGMVLEFGDKLYDASASRKLEAFKSTFRDNLYISKIISR